MGHICLLFLANQWLMWPASRWGRSSRDDDQPLQPWRNTLTAKMAESHELQCQNLLEEAVSIS